jgi:hypothetical protein
VGGENTNWHISTLASMTLVRCIFPGMPELHLPSSSASLSMLFFSFSLLWSGIGFQCSEEANERTGKFMACEQIQHRSVCPEFKTGK